MPLLVLGWLRRSLFALLVVSVSLPWATASEWQSLIRNAPYHISLGMTENLQTLRRWVLLSEGYCENENRHILFDLQGRFVSWMENTEDETAMQGALNAVRKKLYDDDRIDTWSPGTERTLGYPFSFSCNQPHVDIESALGRLTAPNVWGTWDGLTAGSETSPISLADTAKLVFDLRQSQLNMPLKELEFELFLAQMVIESGAVKNAKSRDNAIGILQLRSEALADCGIPSRFYRHRMAQVDCAFRLYVLNRRNLEEPFNARFSHLPDAKKMRLLSLLLVQTYHSGIGNMQRLLGEGEQSKAGRYFAENHARYSAEDILTGMLFHNIGREPWGWESLFYLMDIELVEQRIKR
jgi:hypothetical protein